MNKMKKIGLTALAASLVSVSAQAADVSISGSAGLTYASGNDGVNGNPWSMTDNVTLSWGGELDNGMTVDLSFLLDNSDGAAAQIFDNRSLAIGMGDAGTLTFHGQAGSGVVGTFDDRTPNAYEESWNGGDSPNQGHSTSNMFYYTNSLDAATIHASFTPAGTAGDAASTEVGVVVNATDNLELYGAVGTDNGAASAVDNTILGATITMGAATLGIQANEADSATANADEEFTAWSISYAVSEDMSVAFGQSEINYEAAATSSQESTGISASYTMGSMTLAGVLNSIDNQNLTNATGAGNQDTNTDTFEVNLSFAF
jgi:outer membrane protein OmpU